MERCGTDCQAVALAPERPPSGARLSRFAAVPVVIGLLIACSGAGRAAVTVTATMAGRFAQEDGQTVRATLDLSRDNSDYDVMGTPYLFQASAHDSDTARRHLYGLALEDLQTGQVYAFVCSQAPQSDLSLTATVSGSEFIGDGAMGCVPFTLPISEADLRARMSDSSVPLAVVSASFVDGPLGAPQQIVLTASQHSPGEAWDLPAGVHASDLVDRTTWEPTVPSHLEPLPDEVPAGGACWTQTIRHFTRRVTLSYDDPKLGSRVVKQRSFDVAVTRYGPVRLAAEPPNQPDQPAVPAAPLRVAKRSLRGLFFTVNAPDSAPVYEDIDLDSAGPSLIPVAGQDMIVFDLTPALADSATAAHWSEGGSTEVESVTCDQICLPIPADPAQPVHVALEEPAGPIDIKATLPAGIDWAHPRAIPIDFAVLDGMDDLNEVLAGGTIWPGYTGEQGTCFVMIPETDLYGAMLLVPRSMPPDYRAAMLSHLGVVDSDRYAGPTWGGWAAAYTVYTVGAGGIATLFGSLEPELGQRADIGFTSVLMGSPCSIEFIRLLPGPPTAKPLSATDVAVPLGVAAHEGFHAFMLRREIARMLAAAKITTGLPKSGSITAKRTRSSLQHMQAIDRSLDSTSYVDGILKVVQAAAESDRGARTTMYRAAMELRAKAVSRLSKDAADELILEEDTEGTATYVGLSAQMALAGGVMPLEKRVPGGFGSIRSAPPSGRVPLFYQMGYLMCLALDDLQPDWKSAWMKNPDSISEMLTADLAAR